MTAAELPSLATPATFGSWHDRPVAQQPEWPDPVARRDVLAELESYPPLVFSAESDRLRSRLAKVADGEAFVLQGGDCAERFDQVSADHVRGKIQVLMQMAVVLSYASSLPVVKLGRIAGQYAKPRSKPVETRDGITLPVYRGDAVNGMEFSAAARTPDPSRLKRAYHSSAATLNLVRAYVASADADLCHIHERNRLFARRCDNPRYGRLLHEMEAALAFMRTFHGDESRASEFFTSHEALLLDYERAMTRIDPTTGRYFDASAHMVWIGERTRRTDGAHVTFASRISNPVGVKLGPGTTADDALTLVDRLDPDREPGRLTFITRMGAGRVRELLPELVTKVAASGARVVWLCDPMHGNTFTTSNGYKTRHFEDVLEEVVGFFEVHRAVGTHPGGIHLELTGDDVTECLGPGVSLDALGERYESACDPRLSRDQAMDLAFRLAEVIGDR
jgi:3-deoxy-7-phosphoheptulonate synthase